LVLDPAELLEKAYEIKVTLSGDTRVGFHLSKCEKKDDVI
jgi:hypothetical protein